MRLKEINNGRMAMLAAFGIVAAELATGKDAIQQCGLSAVAMDMGSRVSQGSAFVGGFAQGQARALGVVRRAEAVAAKFEPSKQLGAMQPLGYFDPLGFSKVGDESGFRNLRAAEIKHGRVAMMAAVGAVLQHYVKFPGFEGVPAGLAAVAAAPGTYGFAALFAVAGALELAVWTENPSKEPGNFGDPVGLNQYTEDQPCGSESSSSGSS